MRGNKPTSVIIIGPGRGLLLGIILSVFLLGALGAVAGIVYQGTQNINMGGKRIMNLSHPGSGNDIATQYYVENKTRAIFRGTTSRGVNGNLGGWYGANKMCNGNYSGSHMCTASELAESGLTAAPSDGWLLCDQLSGDGSVITAKCSSSWYYLDSGSTTGGGYNCQGWTSSSALDQGFYYTSGGGTNNQFTTSSCSSTTLYILCCS